MDGPDYGVLIAVIALIAILLVLVVMPFAARRDHVARPRRTSDDGATVIAGAGVFGSDGGASCSDGGGGSC